MKTFPWFKAAISLIFLFVFWMYFTEIPYVPFHPDESTQIYMSADSGESPFTLAYLPDDAMEGRMRYRLLDAPLTHTLIGWGLMLQGQQPLQADWNWTKSWDENSSAGALPSESTLLAARLSVAWLFPFSCLFLFLAARRIDGIMAALLAVLLMATNALVLIHTRRAMAESALLFALCASLWWMTKDSRNLWLAAFPLGLAVNAKQTTLPLTAVGFIQVLFQRKAGRISTRILKILGFLAILLAITWAFNPVFWKSPVSTAKAGLAIRQDLSARMREDYHSSGNPVEQSAFLVAQTFMQPPAAADVGNYAVETRDQVDAYLSHPQNTFFRGFFGGEISLILTLTGLVLITRRVFKPETQDQYPALIFLIITLVSILTILLFTPVPFQRYYALLVPLFSIAQAAALRELAFNLIDRYKKGLSRF